MKRLLINCFEVEMKQRAKANLPKHMDCLVKIGDIGFNEMGMPVAKKVQTLIYCKN